MSAVDQYGDNFGDMAWMLTSTAFVFLMTPGLAFFYGGLVNEGSVINTMMLSFTMIGLITLLWGLFTYSLAFGPSTVDGVIGNVDLAASKFGYQLRSASTDGSVALTISEQTYMVFQLMFAIITSAIISGSVVGRMKFWWFVAFSVIWHCIVYTSLAHWIFYYGGWLFQYQLLDFAGGMVVHTSSGVSAFVLAFWLGRGKTAHRPHNVPYVLLGAALLWFGWFGFNAGSALSANFLAAQAFVNTQWATAVAMLTWNVLETIFSPQGWFKGSPTAVGAACGAVAGLVGITPACGYVSNGWAYFIGFFTALIVFFTPRALAPLGVHDALDCFAFHGVGGITGSLLTGLFAEQEFNAGGFNGAFFFNAPQFGKQIVGVLVTVLMSTVSTTVIYWVLWACAKLLKTTLVISPENQDNVDVSQHGEKAYVKAMEEFKNDVSVKAGAAAPALEVAKPSEVKAEEPAAATASA
jgi:Amt family ammonium transporter